MKKKIFIIGIGMGGACLITKKALMALDSSETIIGSERVTKPFLESGKRVVNAIKADEIASFIRNSQENMISVLMSGDCGFYSGAENLLPYLRDFETEVICGISSPVYLCSKLGISWHDMCFVSLHGKETNIVRNVSSHEKTFFLLGGKITACDVCRKLCEYSLDDTDVCIGENLSYENERVLCGKASDFTEEKTDNLCVMIVFNHSYERFRISGIPDEEFIRGEKIPMTKSEIRTVVVSKLNINSDDVCWDIGGGTGSVSVEMALRCTDGKVYSVEKNITAVKLIDMNRHKFKCDNIDIIHDAAEKSISSLPMPDCVFIGGTNGKLKCILKNIFDKNPQAKIILTAVSLETLNEGITEFEKRERKYEVLQIAVTRTKKVGTHTMLLAENPVFIICSVS